MYNLQYASLPTDLYMCAMDGSGRQQAPVTEGIVKKELSEGPQTPPPSTCDCYGAESADIQV